jgi:hypothetical protein
MIIERERYLDDGSEGHLSIAVQSRSLRMHSLLTALTIEERTAVSDILGRALDDVIALLRQKLGASPEVSS